MKNECHIVRDLMPLYTEGMLSDESASFVKAHLETCENCRAAYSGEEKPPVTEADTAQQRAGEAGVLRTLKKKLRKQTWCAIIITVAVVLLVTLMLRLNSIDYLADISATKGYTFSDRMALLFKGGISDRTQAQRVLNNNVYAGFQYSEKEACDIANVAEVDVPSYYGALRHILAANPEKCGSNMSMIAMINQIISDGTKEPVEQTASRFGSWKKMTTAIGALWRS